jgi:hypothetical protein
MGGGTGTVAVQGLGRPLRWVGSYDTLEEVGGGLVEVNYNY